MFGFCVAQDRGLDLVDGVLVELMLRIVGSLDLVVWRAGGFARSCLALEVRRAFRKVASLEGRL